MSVVANGDDGLLKEALRTTPRGVRMRRLLEWAIPAGAVGLGVVLVAGPIVSTFMRSATVSAGQKEWFGLANFLDLLTSARVAQALLNTLATGICVTLFAGILGCVLAFLVARTDMPGRRTWALLNLLPFFASPYVGAMAWQYLAASHSGIMQNLARRHLGLDLSFININSIAGVIWVLTLFYTPYIYLFVIGPMRGMDGALEDAARVHGARFWLTARKITLPLLMPALLSGSMIVFVTSAGLFDVPLVLTTPKAIPTIPNQIFEAVNYPSDLGRAAALGVFMILVTMMFSVLQSRYTAKRRFDTVTGKGYRPRLVVLGPKAKAAALFIQGAYVFLGAILPLVVVMLAALSKLWTGTFDPSRASLSNFEHVLFHYELTRGAIVNSLFLSFAGASLGVGLGLLQAYYLKTHTTPFSRFMTAVLALPIGMPGIIFGLGFLIMLIGTPLYATLWILLIAYVAHYFPLALRSMSAMFLSLGPELEHSARASGANWFQTMRYVVLPLMRPAMTASWLMLFIILVRELGSTILLYGQGTETISVVMVILSEQNFLYVAALAMVQVVFLLAGFIALSWSGSSLLDH